MFANYRLFPAPHQIAETLQAYTTPAANFRYATRTEPGMAMVSWQHRVLNSLTAQMDNLERLMSYLTGQSEMTEIFGGILDGHGQGWPQGWPVREESA